jgi:deoxyribonuclease-4
MRIGAHVPMAGGLLAALDYAVSTGCEAAQIFSKSPRRWMAPPLDEEVCVAFRSGCESADMRPVFCHASYLINLGAEDPLLWERSIAALSDELVRGRQVGAAGVVLHLGRRYSDDEGECLARVSEAAARAADIPGDVPPLLLENSAGAGRQFGVSVDEMVAAVAAVRAAGVETGMCLDTCHALAAGIDVRTPQVWARLLDAVERGTGAGTIALVHANDCKGDFGSHRDRHEWIGDGCVGEAGFHAMFEQAALAGAAAVVEMPGETPQKDEVNVRRLKAIRDDVAASSGPNPEPA